MKRAFMMGLQKERREREMIKCGTYMGGQSKNFFLSVYNLNHAD